MSVCGAIIFLITQKNRRSKCGFTLSILYLSLMLCLNFSFHNYID